MAAGGESAVRAIETETVSSEYFRVGYIQIAKSKYYASAQAFPKLFIKSNRVDWIIMRNSIKRLRMLIWNYVRRLKLLKEPCLKYCVDNKLLPSLFCEVDSKDLRNLLCLPECRNETQLNQDVFALIQNNFKPGYFIEIGANDGIELSNTLYLEEEFGWSGLLVEANPRYMDCLQSRNNSKIANIAISDARGTASFVDAGLYGGLVETLDKRHASMTSSANVIEVPCETFETLVSDFDIPDQVDFISIDIEGGELTVIKQVIACGVTMKCGCIEVNERSLDKESIENLLEENGYEVVWKEQTGSDIFFRISNEA